MKVAIQLESLNRDAQFVQSTQVFQSLHGDAQFEQRTEMYNMIRLKIYTDQ
jgi:hypothetical protein